MNLLGPTKTLFQNQDLQPPRVRPPVPVRDLPEAGDSAHQLRRVPQEGKPGLINNFSAMISLIHFVCFIHIYVFSCNKTLVIISRQFDYLLSI